jgi:site-specific DNA-methyltransferase (adenine-specific)
MISEDLLNLATPVKNLKLLEGNPRKGDVAAVAKSLDTFGQRKPIVALRDGTVIAGNHTLQAAVSLGWDEIAVVYTDDDPVTAKAYALADNRTAELGGYDDEALAALMSEVAEADLELFAATAWTIDDLESLLADAEEALPLPEDIDDVPEPPPAVSKVGDMWILGDHRVICGDSTDAATVSKLMDSDIADMVWTDPPYGVSYAGVSGTPRIEIENDNLGSDDLYNFLKAAFGNAAAHCKQGGAWFVAAPAGPAMFAFSRILFEMEIWRQSIVWLKDSIVMGHSDYHYKHEQIFYGWLPGAAHQDPPDRKQDSVWEIARPKRSADHPTMKPVALIEKSLLNHTKRGAIVLDTFGGSGSTMAACEATKRKARLVEFEPHYVDVICKRYQLLSKQMPVNAETGEAYNFDV